MSSSTSYQAVNTTIYDAKTFWSIKYIMKEGK